MTNTNRRCFSASYQDDFERELIIILLASIEKSKKIPILTSLKAEMFTNRTYRQIFSVVSDLYEKGKDLEFFTICEQIGNKACCELLEDLNKEYISATTYKYYVKKLVDRYLTSLIENASSKEDFEYIEKEKKQWDIANTENNYAQIGANAELLICKYYDDAEKMLSTGYKSIDNIIGTLQGGDFIILAGQTSMGKTCMMLNLVQRIALKNYKVLLYSLEMPITQIQNRLICANLGINSNKFRAFGMTEGEIEKYNEFASKGLKYMPITICDKSRVTIEMLKYDIPKNPADIVFIDYLGLISGDDKKGVYERFGDISRELKILAVETQKPIIALHQLNRSSFDRQDKRPRVSDLRDSGKIEQDADMIWFVHRPAYFDEYAPKENLQFIVAKNRHGSCGLVELVYNAKLQKITEYKGI